MASRRRAQTRRSRSGWTVRGVLALAAAGAGYVSVTSTAAYVIRLGNPELAHVLSPNDGRITEALAAKWSGPQAAPADRESADRLAKEALRQDPTAVTAASTLGINAQVRGDTPQARRVFAYASFLSRRDLQTQLWSIEDAVSRGNISEALTHYDIALRTSRNAAALLFPVLASAISETSVRENLVHTLAGHPSWADLFIEYASGNTPDPKAAAQLFEGLVRAGVPVSSLSRSLLINTLASRNDLADAWSFYASTHPGADPAKSRDIYFTGNIDHPSVFDWTPGNEDGIVTSIQRSQRGGVADFFAPASVGGTLLQQVQMFSPGTYRLEGHGTGIEQPANSRPYWVLTCRSGQEVGRVELPNSVQNGGKFSGQFVVPDNCPVQVLSLVARPSDAISGTTGQIDWLQVVPTR